jgi:cystathionine beta-lyase
MVSISYQVKKEDAIDFLEKIKIFTLAESRWSRVAGKLLGNDGHHVSIPEDKRKEIGIDDLVRLRVLKMQTI